MNAKCINLETSLNERGYKLSPQRQAVMDVIFNNKEKLLSYEEIYESVKEIHPDIGLAAVYRALPLLENMGLLHTIHLDDGCIKYEGTIK